MSVAEEIKVDEDLSGLIARLLARGFLPRTDATVIRILTEPQYRDALDRRLAGCGLRLLDNPFAAHVALGIQADVARSVFQDEDRWLANTIGLSKPETALLVVIWALLILPKRARQQSRADSPQGGLFGSPPLSRESTERISEEMLYQEFAHLGARTYLTQRLSILSRHKFIIRSGGEITEGPLLDLALDYTIMAARIIDGTLRDIKTLLRKPAPNPSAAPMTADEGADSAGGRDDHV
jgi:hypothetical protein